MTFRTGVNVDAERADAILKEYDAVILACGAKKARSLSVKVREMSEDPQGESSGPVPAQEVPGVRFAVDFLTENTKRLLSGSRETRGTAKGKHVVIVGGGDTGNDCIQRDFFLGAERRGERPKESML